MMQHQYNWGKKKKNSLESDTCEFIHIAWPTDARLEH